VAQISAFFQGFCIRLSRLAGGPVLSFSMMPNPGRMPHGEAVGRDDDRRGKSREGRAYATPIRHRTKPAGYDGDFVGC
jgi:hypothetical protein